MWIVGADPQNIASIIFLAELVVWAEILERCSDGWLANILFCILLRLHLCVALGWHFENYGVSAKMRWIEAENVSFSYLWNSRLEFVIPEHLFCSFVAKLIKHLQSDSLWIRCSKIMKQSTQAISKPLSNKCWCNRATAALRFAQVSW